MDMIGEELRPSCSVCAPPHLEAMGSSCIQLFDSCIFGNTVVAVTLLLFALLQLIMLTACPGGRSAGSVDKAEAHSDSLEQLSATALLQLLKLADATQQLAALFDKLPLQQDEQQPEAHAQQQDHDAEGSESPAAISAAIVPRLPQLEQCISKLMENSCFKEAHTAAECLMLLGRHLGSSLAAQDSAAAAADAGAAAGQQQQKDSKPAFVMLSHWAETALQQDEPEVKSVALAKILLDMYMRFGEPFASCQP